MAEYLSSLGAVPSWRFEEYVDVLEYTLEDRVERMPGKEEPYGPGLELGGLESENVGCDAHAIDRRMYRELLDGLDEVESKEELRRYSRELVETDGLELPWPMNLVTRPLDIVIEGQRFRALEEVFDEAKRELDAELISRNTVID